MNALMPGLVLTIDGNRFHDIPGFYDEMNRVFMAAEDWQLGDSLDALNDMLYGGYGAIHGAGSVRLRWLAMNKSAADLGLVETQRWLADKLRHPETFNTDAIRRQLETVTTGKGLTFFQIVMEIFAQHPEIDLVPA